MNAIKRPSFARLITSATFAVVCLIIGTAANAATFQAGRGISFDQWVTWPNETRWNDADVLENFPEWQRFVSDEEIGALKTYGLQTVRVPVDPAIFLFNDDANRRMQLFDGIHSAIGRLQKAGLNVIIDMHTISYADDRNVVGIDDVLNDDLTFVNYKALIEEMADTLAKYDPAQVALELINEPNYDCTKDDLSRLWQAQASQLHQAARAANDTITLIIPGGCYGSAEGLSKIEPTAFADTNIIWTFHSYEPFVLTHQSAGWAGEPISAFKNLPYPPNKMDRAALETLHRHNSDYIDPSLRGATRTNAGWYIRNELTALRSPKALKDHLKEPFEEAAIWADKNNIPRANIFLGEFGFIGQEYGNDFATDPQWRLAYLKDMIALADQYGFAWSIWSYGGAFGMVQSFGGKAAKINLLEQLRLPKTN